MTKTQRITARKIKQTTANAVALLERCYTEFETTFTWADDAIRAARRIIAQVAACSSLDRVPSYVTAQVNTWAWVADYPLTEEV